MSMSLLDDNKPISQPHNYAVFVLMMIPKIVMNIVLGGVGYSG